MLRARQMRNRRKLYRQPRAVSYPAVGKRFQRQTAESPAVRGDALTDDRLFVPDNLRANVYAESLAGSLAGSLAEPLTKSLANSKPYTRTDGRTSQLLLLQL